MSMNKKAALSPINWARNGVINVYTIKQSNIESTLHIYGVSNNYLES